jgi:hypothetical protein
LSRDRLSSNPKLYASNPGQNKRLKYNSQRRYVLNTGNLNVRFTGYKCYGSRTSIKYLQYGDEESGDAVMDDGSVEPSRSLDARAQSISASASTVKHEVLASSCFLFLGFFHFVYMEPLRPLYHSFALQTQDNTSVTRRHPGGHTTGTWFKFTSTCRPS